MRRWLPVLIVALVVLAFWPAFSAGFLDWDDDRNFTDNTAYRGLSAQHLAWMATTHHMGPYQPLSWWTLGVDYTLWGMDPRGYHATNVLLHALTALAFYALALRLLPLCWKGANVPGGRAVQLAAAAAALLFALHPLRCESVVWVTERRDVLSGVFFVLTLWAWLRFVTAVPELARAGTRRRSRCTRCRSRRRPPGWCCPRCCWCSTRGRSAGVGATGAA